MKSSRASSEAPSAGTFARLEDFLEYARKRADASARIPFFLANGQLQYLDRDLALDRLDKVRKFLAAPELLRNPTLHDGRIAVALTNYANLTQHLRWAAGLDRDSIPGKSEAERLMRWGGAASFWFWFNGGPAPEGFSGSYQDWARSLDANTGRRQPPAQLAEGIGAMP